MPLFSGSKMCRSPASMEGKTVIITGANTGIGKETARDIFKRGGRVIIACRDQVKGEEAAKDIQKDNPSKADAIIIKKLDLASLTSVRAFAQDINDTESHIHVLINNAGVMLHPEAKTEDGFEMHFGVNHLGHFLLTNLLLDKIKASAPSRIVNLSSMAHKYGKMNFDDIFMQKKYSIYDAYSQSKLANLLFTLELAKRLKGSGVSVYAVHPGVVNTELWRHSSETTPFFIPFVVKHTGRFVMKNPVQGAQTTIYCAVTEEIQDQSGLYYSDCAVKQPTSRARNEEDAKKLWELSCQLVNFEDN